MMLAALSLMACLPVESGHILARDLAAAWPAFGAVAAETPVAYAPVPGARRHFGPVELARLAARFGVREPAPAEVCFEVPMTELAAGPLQAAMRAALDIPDARVTVEEFSRFAVPRGEIVFSRPALHAPAPGARAGAVVWRGFVLYSGGLRFPIWARARITARRARVLAREPLRAGVPITEAQVKLEMVEEFPVPGPEPESLARVAGRRPRRAIPAGWSIPLGLLEEPSEVERGESVRVEVTSGGARLVFTGRAESSGRAGEKVRVRNPESQRVFEARVAGKGAVAVNTAGGVR